MRNLADVPPDHVRKTPLVVESTLSKSVYIKLYLYLFFRNKLFFAIFFGFIVLVLLLSIGEASDLPSFFILLFGILVGAYTVYGVASTLHHAYSPKNENLFLPTHYTFDEEKVVARTGTGQTAIRWDAFVGWRVIAEWYVLFYSARNIIVIPSSAVPAHDVPEFRAFLYEKIGKKS